jgi:hypothetical protein
VDHLNKKDFDSYEKISLE